MRVPQFTIRTLMVLAGVVAIYGGLISTYKSSPGPTELERLLVTIAIILLPLFAGVITGFWNCTLPPRSPENAMVNRFLLAILTSCGTGYFVASGLYGVYQEFVAIKSPTDDYGFYFVYGPITFVVAYMIGVIFCPKRIVSLKKREVIPPQL